MRLTRANYLPLVIVGILSIIASFLSGVAYASPGRVRIEEVSVQPYGGLELDAGVDYEFERQHAGGQSYDSIRVAPLSLSLGLIYDFEISVNSPCASLRTEDNPDLENSGVEALETSLKYRWNQNFAITAGARTGGNNDVYPYGKDSPAVQWFNLPVKTPAGPGAVLYEIGYTFADGRTAGGQEYKSHWNFGVGYKFVVSPHLVLRSEIIGREKMYENSSKLRELLLGFDWRSNRFRIYRPRFRLGFKDGDPDFSAGLELVFRFGNQGGEPEPVRQEFKRTPIFGSEPEAEDQRPVVLPQPEVGPGVEPPSELGDSAAREVLAHVGDGLESFQDGDLSGAARSFEKALELDPENTGVLINLATVYYYQNKYEKAAELYGRVVEQSPEDVIANLGLGAARYQLEDFEAAREQFNRVLELDPGNSRASQWLEELPGEG